jgi:hypothetical protein
LRKLHQIEREGGRFDRKAGKAVMQVEGFYADEYPLLVEGE